MAFVGGVENRIPARADTISGVPPASGAPLSFILDERGATNLGREALRYFKQM